MKADKLESANGELRPTHPVVIVGAGPAGLSIAIELGHRGVQCILIERNDRVGFAPRAKTTNVRSRTHMRRWGIASLLADASPFGIDYPSDVFFVTRLAGPQLARIPNSFNCAPERNDAYPEHAQWIPQYKLEQVLRAHAETLPTVSIRFNVEFLAAEEKGEQVEVTFLDLLSSTEGRLTGAYLVGADGAHSRVRDAIGAKMIGDYGLSRNYNIVFRAPGLADAHRHGRGTMYWQVNPQAPSLVGPMDRDDIWFFMPTKIPHGAALSDEEAAQLIRDATGIDLPYEILSRDEWVASALVADRYRLGRMLLIGDACHLHPPFGGYGMNMGIGDAVDLGWKLAAILRGWGGPALLDSYDAERRPVHEQVIAEAVANHAALSNEFLQPGIEEEGEKGDALRAAISQKIRELKQREFHTLGTVLGYCYANSPIILTDEAEQLAPSGIGYTPSARPGCLAPHAWLRDGRSLYDLFGEGFTLILGTGSTPECVTAAREEAKAAGIPFTTIDLADEAPIEHYGPLTLVRPDQHVGWRGRRWRPGVLAHLSGMIAEMAPSKSAVQACAEPLGTAG